jgi:hypothetical protein
MYVMKGLTNDERELIIRINAGDPDVIEIDVTIPKFRRQLERWGFKPVSTDEFGGARFILSTKELKPFSRRKKRKGMTEAQKLAGAARLKKARKPKKAATNETVDQPT